MIFRLWRAFWDSFWQAYDEAQLKSRRPEAQAKLRAAMTRYGFTERDRTHQAGKES